MSDKTPSEWDSHPDWTPKVTAILPCYNAEAFISDTLKSLAAQTWPNLEILIGDDASSDQTLAIVEAFTNGRDNTRIVARKQNLGWIANTNALMAQASGELMFFAFHDDLIAPTYVERLVEALRQNPRAVLAYCDVDLVRVDGTHHHRIFDGLSGGRGPLARGSRMALRFRNGWVPIHGLFRAEAFHRIGGLKRHDEGEFIADWPWLLHMALLGEFERVPETLCQELVKKTGVSKNWGTGAEKTIAVERSSMREIRQSGLGPFSKAALIVCVKLSRKRQGLPRLILRPVKTLVKRLLDR